MENFKQHSIHVKYHKNQISQLFDNQKKQMDAIICQWDFAENYVHEKTSIVSVEHYGKEQNQLLIVSFWFYSNDSTLENPIIGLNYRGFTSNYLLHDIIFFDKCFQLFIDGLISVTMKKIERIHILTDEAQQHFKNRRTFNNISKLSAKNSNYYILFIKYIKIFLEWIFDPTYHGKGPCDEMAAVIKQTTIYLF
jgi:hypothetical protein